MPLKLEYKCGHGFRKIGDHFSAKLGDGRKIHGRSVDRPAFGTYKKQVR